MFQSLFLHHSQSQEIIFSQKLSSKQIKEEKYFGGQNKIFTEIQNKLSIVINY